MNGSAIRSLVMGCLFTAALVAQSGVTQYCGLSSSDTPYLLGLQKGMIVASILTTGDTVSPAGTTPYRFGGIPDGLGTFNNNDGTFTVLCGHEYVANVGTPRAHSTTGGGAFVSKWVIQSFGPNSCGFKVLSGEDQIQDVANWNPATQTWDAPTHGNVFNRFCSGDLPALSAFKFATFGFNGRIFMNGEEVSDGRAWAHVVTGDHSGTTYELPRFGRSAFENCVANPSTGLKTVVACLNDTSPTGQVYFYVGTKQRTGNPVERAGLDNGTLYGVKIPGAPLEDRGVPFGSAVPFTLAPLGNVSGITPAAQTNLANSLGVTGFLRPEDGSWDPANPDHFYFVTTDRLDTVKDGVGTTVGRSRLYRLRFYDRANPDLGGLLDTLLDGTEAGNMFDNITLDHAGHILLQEDVGNAVHNGKIWEYDIAADTLTLAVKHDPVRFGDIGIPPKAPFTIDEESSGIIDASSVLGRGWFLCDVQAHYANANPTLYEGGQLLAIYLPNSDDNGRSGFNPDCIEDN